MATRFKTNHLTLITIAYWFLLLYIIAALVWWYIALQTQNQQNYTFQLQQLNTSLPNYTQHVQELTAQKERKQLQYLGEGITFLLFILAGAFFVFRATRKQFALSKQQQNFMMAVTHELKTPIATTRLNIETLLKHSLTAEQQQKMLQACLQEMNRLNMLTHNILLVAQLESENYYVQIQPLNLSDLVLQCVDDFKNRYPYATIEANVHPLVWIKGDDMLLQLAISNIIENAIKYSAPQPVIHIQLIKNTKQKKAQLHIADNGIGIPNKEKKKIFHKFYRIGNEQTRNTKGTGIGLYLCKKIIKQLKGSIKVSDNQPRGTVFTVFFKLFENNE